MAQQQAASKPGQLAVQNSNSSSCVFKPISSPGKLESLGLTPVPKVRVRPTSMKKKKPSALDKQYRHVALLQRHNRRAAAHAAKQAAEQQRQQRELAGTCQQLRANILAGDTEAVLQTWQPAAAAAALQEQQAAAAATTQQSQHLHSSKLPSMYDLPHLRRSQSPQQGSAALRAAAQQVSCSPGSASCAGDDDACRKGFAGGGQLANEQAAAAAAAAAVAAEQNAKDDDDVDGFLDGLLQQATAQKAGGSHMHSSSKAAGTCEQAATAAATSRPGSAAGSAACAGSLRTATVKQQKSKAKPAWALSEQQQAEAAAAAVAAAAAEAEAEERELLQFAEGLSWEQIVGQLDDEQLAAAFQELDTAEQQAAAGDPAADKQWRRCFVTALNHAVMQGVSAATAAAAAATAGAAGSEAEHDKHSVASSASQARRAEAIAARRQNLLDRLSRIGGSGSKAGSSCGGASRFGGEHNRTLAAGGEQDGWDGSTRVGGDDVALLTSALKGLEVGELLAECPEMRGVHSVASVRSMLLKAEGQNYLVGADVALLTSALNGLEAGELLAECPEMKGVHSVASVRSMLLKAEGQNISLPPAFTTGCRQVHVPEGTTWRTQPCSRGWDETRVGFCNKVKIVLDAGGKPLTTDCADGSGTYIEVTNPSGQRGNWLKLSPTASSNSTLGGTPDNCNAAACGEPSCDSLSQRYCAGCGVSNSNSWRLTCVAAGGQACTSGTATPRLCSSLNNSSNWVDGCPDYWFDAGCARYNYRQTYANVPTGDGDECNVAGKTQQQCCCTGALPPKPPGAQPWSSSCQGQASCSTQCDTAAGFSPGTVSITCNTATKTWSPASGSCTSPSGTGCTGAKPPATPPPGFLPWSDCQGTSQVSCIAQCDTAKGYKGGPFSLTCDAASNRWQINGECSKETTLGCTDALPPKPPGAQPWSSSCQGQASCSTQCDTAAGFSPGTVSITCNTATNTWSPPSGSCRLPSDTDLGNDEGICKV
ncbi:hypothetical protein OEZ85_000227 [Tetradesmus obliquus]|uniref:Sushi domain-containing protein n=1 Tax=Tetradesmus obliquus TaxID=3088 RepID=A0ABY8UPK1_TETOB|nr:hypothetical protein OEZ85_000227 [Tetradesmus obliquus]